MNHYNVRVSATDAAGEKHQLGLIVTAATPNDAEMYAYNRLLDVGIKFNACVVSEVASASPKGDEEPAAAKQTSSDQGMPEGFDEACIKALTVFKMAHDLLGPQNHIEFAPYVELPDGSKEEWLITVQRAEKVRPAVRAQELKDSLRDAINAMKQMLEATKSSKQASSGQVVSWNRQIMECQRTWLGKAS